MKKYAEVDFFSLGNGSAEELRKKQVLDTVRILGFAEDRIKKDWRKL